MVYLTPEGARRAFQEWVAENEAPLGARERGDVERFLELCMEQMRIIMGVESDSDVAFEVQVLYASVPGAIECGGPAVRQKMHGPVFPF